MILDTGHLLLVNGELLGRGQHEGSVCPPRPCTRLSPDSVASISTSVSLFLSSLSSLSLYCAHISVSALSLRPCLSTACVSLSVCFSVFAAVCHLFLRLSLSLSLSPCPNTGLGLCYYASKQP